MFGQEVWQRVQQHSCNSFYTLKLRRCVIKEMEDRVMVVNNVACSLELTFKMFKLKWALTTTYPDIGSVF